MKVINLCTFLLCSILLVGCSSTRPPLTDDASTVTESYILGAGDTVNIMVYGEPEMTMKFIIDKSGAITFPYIGKLMLKGKTAEQVGKEITKKLRGHYLQNPMVTVSIAEFRKFYVSGEVRNPNGYAYEPGMTVEKSIALAGGFTDRADRKDINIRLSGNNELLENVALAHSVRPGDVVIIGMGFF
ncbi:polysaccharide export protein [Escherichia coli]|nr:polysaccharide export protein [Escherichia coli]